ncbi:MAG: HD domain-containing protein [Clostridia bacterium]|nr:HD domain-containing protein [Clostridia bacterium]
MIISQAVEKMISFYGGNLHDIDHFLKVWAFAKTISEKELTDAHEKKILELSAVVHDIACPLCREKYGNADGKKQELESPALVEKFFEDFPISETDKKRISWLVAHHHTYTDVDGPDHRILLEADFLVNAGESGFSKKAIENARAKIFETETGKRLLEEIYG